MSIAGVECRLRWCHNVMVSRVDIDGGMGATWATKEGVESSKVDVFFSFDLNAQLISKLSIVAKRGEGSKSIEPPTLKTCKTPFFWLLEHF